VVDVSIYCTMYPLRHGISVFQARVDLLSSTVRVATVFQILLVVTAVSGSIQSRSLDTLNLALPVLVGGHQTLPRSSDVNVEV
jgi:hypothetical protein